MCWGKVQLEVEEVDATFLGKFLDMTLAVRKEVAQGMIFPNGTWTGMVGDIHAKRADLALGPMSITYDRIQAVYFPPQIITEYLTILAGFPDRVEVSAFGTLMVFQWQVSKASTVSDFN
ncbi:hypothetical protein MTO96_035218 [Rhipicephalus appendiculatus]